MVKLEERNNIMPRFSSSLVKLAGQCGVAQHVAEEENPALSAIKHLNSSVEDRSRLYADHSLDHLEKPDKTRNERVGVMLSAKSS